MAGTWPNLDAQDLEDRVRTYLNEVTADFYTQAEIWRWLSIAAKDIAQKTLCVRRVIDAVTVVNTREVATLAYKVLHVEYVPTSERARMLTKIDPLLVGHYPYNATTMEPKYWYEFGANIGIDPVDTDTAYKLRLYVADLPKMVYQTFTDAGDFTEGAGAAEWATTAGWAGPDTAAHTGAGPDNYIYNTAFSAVDVNVTLIFTVSAISGGTGTVTPYAGGTAGIACTTDGVHVQTLTATDPWTVKLTGSNTVTVDDLYVLKEADFAAATDQTELPPAYQHLLALYATHGGLTKDRKYGPAQMLESIYNNELAYLRQNMVEVIPDGRNSLKYL